MRLVLVGFSLVLVSACSTTVPKSYLPVDSPLHAWAAPEQDEPAPAATPPAPAAPAPAATATPAAPEKKPATKKGAQK